MRLLTWPDMETSTTCCIRPETHKANSALAEALPKVLLKVNSFKSVAGLAPVF